MASCYILYSPNLDEFYVGATHDILINRLNKHSKTFYEGSFTAKTKDWELFLEIYCDSFAMAVNIEGHIKRMKSRVYINNLKKYPEMVEKLKNKYLSI
jgi:putative endonuclease